MTETGSDSVVVLFKGGRLPSWDALTDQQREEYQQIHVDLMLQVGARHGMIGLEGFRLVTPQQNWQRFWTIEFPTFAGARAWIENEMAPPYGRYGFYEYFLATRWRREQLDAWVTNPLPPVSVPADADPRVVPSLSVSGDSVVVLSFVRRPPDLDGAVTVTGGDEEQEARMKSVARDFGLMRCEAFELIAPQRDWNLVMVAEFPGLAGAEAWIDAAVQPPHGQEETS
ncbi:MAG: hypothetical protein OXH50_16265 [Gemmatimonadetes bacterium]|nr:hypothetical protein [Gemmatimonadota bacterium]